MAEREPAMAPSIEGEASAGALDQAPPDRHASERINDEQLNPVMFVRDDDGNQYILPWELGKDWAQIQSFVEEIYARKGSTEKLETIRDGRFDVKSGNGDIILPSVWSTFINPGTTVEILFWSAGYARSDLVGRDALSKNGGVDVDNIVVDVDADAKEDQEEEYYSKRRHRTRSRRTVSYTSERKSYAPESDPSEDANILREPDPDGGYDIVVEERPRPPGPSNRSQSASSISDDTGDTGSPSESEDNDESPPPPEPIRVANPAIDQEGRPLSFTVNTKWAASARSMGNESGLNSNISKKNSDGRDLNTDTLRITKAVATTAEGKTSVQLHVIPGPENLALSSSIGIRWFHLHADRLDWDQFKTTCLAASDHSERLRMVVMRTLQKIEKERLEAYLGGMFIEPGTVLRGDETSQSEPDSVIFSCVPHFEIGKPPKINPTDKGRLHPSRTLMEAYYPSEPVQDRDEEQAFRKFGNSRNDSLIHVPSFWMLNIGSHIVVTSGYRPLSTEFVKSIEIHPEDLTLLNTSSKENALTSIRLTDWDGRVLLYSLSECQTYFEMERKLRELRFLPGGSGYQRSLQLARTTPKGPQIIKPAMWPQVIRRRNVVFIDLCISDTKKEIGSESETAVQDTEPTPSGFFSQSAVPPFFDWPSAIQDNTDSPGANAVGKEHVKRCLENVEKAMTSESLADYGTVGSVDATFTSTKYYESLTEKTTQDLDMSLRSLTKETTLPAVDASRCTHHQAVVDQQNTELASQTADFLESVPMTLGLFVSDLDSAAMLRKVWGAMIKISTILERINKIGAFKAGSNEYNDPKWKSPMTASRVWWIRKVPRKSSDPMTPLPKSDEDFLKSLQACKLCRRRKQFPDPNDALQHLRQHKLSSEQEPAESLPCTRAPTMEDEKLKDWVINEDQVRLESLLFSCLCILKLANLKACDLHSSLKELVDGVRDEGGALSELYKFPRKLLETLRRLIVFYLAVERSLHFAEEKFRNTPSESMSDLSRSLTALQRFGEGVNMPLIQAREDLCDMARSSTSIDHWKRMSLGPQYVCSWFMRRLIVKPLDESMSAGDMYREYLSTLQFQVNHHPSKRLLRSINLLKEELEALSKVSRWQTRLVENYLCVLDDATYPTDISSRRAMYPYERLLLNSCLESLALSREDYDDLIKRCGPLSESTKQSAEINEEDHGKAILIFTVVTIIFLPLSFVTSYLGMNTSDIRDMDNKQSLFWEIALPLTAVTMGSMLLIAYNGDELRDRVSSIYRSLTGKQDRKVSARGISVAQRKRAAKRPFDSTSTLDYKSLADEAEYATPRPDWSDDCYNYGTTQSQGFLKPELGIQPAAHFDVETIPQRRTMENIQTYAASSPILRRPGIQIRTATIAQDPGLWPDFPPQIARRPGRQPSSFPKPGAPAPLGPGAVRTTAPTCLRVHRKHLLPETLAHYAIPWEPDPKDANYIVITQSMDPQLTEALFQHTREVRRGGTGNAGYREGSEWAPEEYTWVKKRERGGPGARHIRARARDRSERTRFDNSDEEEWYPEPMRRRR